MVGEEGISYLYAVILLLHGEAVVAHYIGDQLVWRLATRFALAASSRGLGWLLGLQS
jgi:hypothetical protein